jgi:hypothetical protein
MSLYASKLPINQWSVCKNGHRINPVDAHMCIKCKISENDQNCEDLKRKLAIVEKKILLRREIAVLEKVQEIKLEQEKALREKQDQLRQQLKRENAILEQEVEKKKNQKKVSTGNPGETLIRVVEYQIEKGNNLRPTGNSPTGKHGERSLGPKPLKSCLKK